ncbi:MAG: proline dehydrogenase family protein [Trueperaceae bacterium]|nr:proline dehydrogenase family protein [Trueperaceae bacterium]
MSRYRDLVLAVAGWGPLERFARRRGLQLGAGRFVAGERLEDGIRVAHALAGQGKYVVLDLLGEFVQDPEAAAEMADGVRAAIRALADVPPPRMVSVKPTQVGLGISFDVALDHLRSLAVEAARAGVRPCLDMEDHPRVDDTLALLEALHDEGHVHVSTVLQSYLRRTPYDLARLLARTPVPEIRLVKGAYREPASVAFPDKADVDRAYREQLEMLLDGGGLVHVATHDEALISFAQAQRAARAVPPERTTFQLLYGVKPRLQASLRAEGERVGVYLPFGADWYGYFTRRLAERPANLAFVLRGLFG